MAAEKLVTPVGELKWVFITGNGKKDLNDNDRYVASITYPKDSPEAQQLQEQVEAFWEENKPKGAKDPKSTGLKNEVVKEQETGNIIANFWTATTFPDGKPKVIKTYNSKGAEVALGSKAIGNGSRGAISGAMAIYDASKVNRGVTLYLNAIQLTKFTPYSSDAGFAVQEDGWTGDDLNDDGMEPVVEL